MVPLAKAHRTLRAGKLQKHSSVFSIPRTELDRSRRPNPPSVTPANRSALMQSSTGWRRVECRWTGLIWQPAPAQQFSWRSSLLQPECDRAGAARAPKGTLAQRRVRPVLHLPSLPVSSHASSYSAHFCVGDARCVQSGGRCTTGHSQFRTGDRVVCPFPYGHSRVFDWQPLGTP